jgi:hypothetical protein
MNRRFWMVGLLVVAPLVAGACAPAAGGDEKTKALPKSVTVFPVVITPGGNVEESFFGRIAETAGELLERAGMEEIELAQATFKPPKTGDVQKIAADFGSFVRDKNLKTEYALFGLFVGTPQTGPQEIHTVVVDKTGKVVFADRADKEAFSQADPKPDCPLTCTIFLVNRLNRVWDLEDPLRDHAPRGKMAQRMRDRSGLPPEEELAEMDGRLETFKKRLQSDKVAVYPIHLWQAPGKQSALGLVQLLTQHDVCQAEAAEIDPRLTIEGDPNQQKILWDTARAFRDFLRKHPPQAAYALLADYGIGRLQDGSAKVNHVHLIVCDRQGDWVLVDYQNSHHADFQEIDPRSPDDCDRLAARRLASRLQAIGE